jgi:hypothetical protein
VDRSGAPLQLDLPLRYRRQRAPLLRPALRRRRAAGVARGCRSTEELQAVQAQLELLLVVVVTEAELWAEQPPVHRVVAAAGLPPPETSAPRSIWDLAGCLGCATSAPPPQDEPPPYPAERPQVIRAVGSTRHIGSAYPANRWTPEREEQERARRARQRPPKPVKKARTRSQKLLDLVGDH